MLDYHEEVIIACLHSPQWRKTFLASDIEESSFDNNIHRWIWSKILPSCGDDIVGVEVCEKILMDDPVLSKNEATIEAYHENLLGLFRKIRKRIKNNEPIIYPNISKNFISHITRKSLIANALKEIIDRMDESAKPEDVYETFENEFNKIRQKFSEADNYEISNPLETLEERIRERKDNFISGRRIQFKSSLLQYFFPLGVSQAEMLLICGDTNVGKSIITENLLELIFGPFNKLNTIYFYTENEKSLSEARFDAMINQVPYTSVYSGEVDDETLKTMLEKYKEMLDPTNNGKLVFVKLVPGRFNIMTISDIVSSLELEHGIIFDVLLCDSPEHQNPSVVFKEFFRAKAQVYFDWKTYLAFTGKIGVSTAQRKVDHAALYKKKSDSKDEVDLNPPSPEEAAGSVEIPRIVDWMLVIPRSKGLDRVLGRSKMWLVKARNSAIPEKPLYVYISKDNLRISLSQWEPPTQDDSEDLDLEELKEDKKKKSSKTGFKKKFEITTEGVKREDD